MDRTQAQVRDFFAAGGHMLVGQAMPPDRIAVRRIGTAYLATMSYGAQTLRVVAKPLLAGAVLHDPAMLYHVHYRLQSADPLLRRVLNNMLAPVPEHAWIIVEYVAGPTLLEVLRSALRFPRCDDSEATTLLAQTARALAAVNRISAAQVRLPLPAQANASYIEALHQCWLDPCVQAWLPAPWQGGPPPQNAGPAFRGRSADRVFPIDCQPKNILVPRRGEVRLIDQDYGVGNPALALAFFLVTLDRMGVRYPLPRQRSRLAAWKAVFLESYFQHADSWIAEDLDFFYTRALLSQLRDVTQGRFLLRHFVRANYARCLREFLRNRGHLIMAGRIPGSSTSQTGGVLPLRRAA